MRKPYKNIFKATVLGVGLGYLAGLLTAKKPGEQTRKDIIDSSKEVQAKAEAAVEDLYSKLTEMIKQAEAKIDKNRLSIRHNLYKAATKANKVKSQTKDILMAVKKGDVTNTDLHKSIDNTKAAIENLKNYLKS
jgi:gas vesicle protein